MILLPLPYTPDVETVAEDEARLTEEIVERMAATNRCAFERHRHGIRDAHAKSNGLLVGELEVHADPVSYTHLRAHET